MIREDPQTTITTPQPAHVQPVTLTAAAAARLQRVMAEKGLPEAGLRVFVSGGGCSGLQYGMAFVTEAEPDDVVFSSEGVQVHVDPVSIQYVQGAHIDFEDNLMGGGFKIENPNAVSACGCGSSFRTKDSGADASGGGCGCH